MSSQHAIGIFDSGIGGLSVLRHIQAQLPHEKLLYFADQAHVPYGSRSAAEITRFSETISRFLLERGARLIVVACNTASAAALTYLRDAFPATPFVGMEPAVKPGAAQTRNGRLGILATKGTFNSRRYAQLTARFAQGIQVFEDPCPGLVELIEAGRLDSPETERLLRACLQPMLAAGVDTLALGCTHYPFVAPLIRRIAGPDIVIIDPAPAVARQTARVLKEWALTSPNNQAGAVEFFTSGRPASIAQAAGHILGRSYPVRAVTWINDSISVLD